MNDITKSNERHNIQSESQRGVVVKKPTWENKNGRIGYCLPLILHM